MSLVFCAVKEDEVDERNGEEVGEESELALPLEMLSAVVVEV